MLSASSVSCALFAGFLALLPSASSAQPRRSSPAQLTLVSALQRAFAANPRLTAAERDVGIATGRRLQAGAVPNPNLSFELDNALGSGQYRGTRSAETTLQLSQLIELGGKREARIAAGDAGYSAARWERAAIRLEVATETAVAFVNVLSGQRRVQIFNAQVASIDRLTPLLQRRVETGASSPAEISRAQVAADFARADLERAKTALSIARRELGALMGLATPNFTNVSGDLSRIGRPAPFQTVARAIDSNPQLMRWTAIYAQRNAELLTARLKVVPDVQAGVGWRNYRDTGDNAVRLNLSVQLPLWNQNQGGILEAQETLAKTEAERSANKIALMVLLGRAYDALTGSSQEASLVRNSSVPRSRQALEVIEAGYAQGRFTLLEVLDAQAAVAQAALREVEALVTFHTAVATIEGLSGSPITLQGISR
ncbi:TolC family protein [Microbacteriaceae bacterium K1510]|nr:TolC family protein [Microbacteriaceae bacterium K1510]